MNTRIEDQPTHYQTLGVSPGADVAEIREAYRSLAKQLHPDVDPRAGAAERFSIVVQAYEVLIERESRSAYDEQLRRAAERASGLGSTLHFNWQNIAEPRAHRSPGGQNEPKSDFDKLYETFFRPPGPEPGKEARQRSTRKSSSAGDPRE